jgi:coenzyme F420 biosynthesis associated uncharacterized protein
VTSAASGLVDWNLATATATRLVPTGPTVSFEEAHAVVAELRSLVGEAEGHVRRFTGLGVDREHEPVAIVDRPGWVRANVDGFRVVLEPLMARLMERRGGTPAVLTAVGARATGLQVGAILAYLATRVLGQYELFFTGNGAGRLTLVAPNVVATERQLGVDPHDFRLWVCLHEVTHRTQFTAVPWLRDHVRGEISAYITASDLDPAAVLGRLKAAGGAVIDALRGRGEGGLLEAVQTPEQRVVLDRLTAVMTLVEGHGEYVMDGVGPTVVPTVAEIRRKFAARREAVGPIDRAIRRLFGIDVKLKQYAEGEEFVRRSVDAVGMAGFNRVWESAATLPTREEIREPARWIARVHGPRALPA